MLAAIAYAGAMTVHAGVAHAGAARATSGAAAPATLYALDATLDPAARAIAGTVDVRVTNSARTPLVDVVLVLYPNRFSGPEPALTDLTRPYAYPHEELVQGGMTIDRLELRHGDEPPQRLVATRSEAIAEWHSTLLRVTLPTALAPGEAAAVRVGFRTVVPERYGPFGVSGGTIVALGGWYPLLAARDDAGAWIAAPDLGPATVTGTVHVPAGYTVVVGPDVETVSADTALPIAASAHDHAGPGGPALLASTRYRRHARVVDGANVELLELPGRFARMFAPGRAPHATLVLDAAEAILKARPSSVALPPAPLVVVEAPLRLELTAPGAPGVAVVSDRILRVDPLLRDFHERALAAAVYAALVRTRVEARERAAAAPWIVEGVATALADRYVASARPHHRTVYDWIGLFNMFAIVDRFESAPKIPFGRAFFPEARHTGELRDGLETFARDRPPGGTIFTKLRNEVGDATFSSTIDAYLAGEAPLRTVAAQHAGRSLDWLFDQWTQPYPEPLNYAVRDARLNERISADQNAGAVEKVGADPDAGSGDAPMYEHHLVVARTAARRVHEPVDVEVQASGDRRARLVWDDDAERAEFVVRTPWKARRVTLDPERRLLEDTRVDDARPPPLQLVLDSADVTVTSSEFGISGLFVARRRYDYRKDVGAVAFYSDRSLGFTVGPRVHFGAPNDPTSYRHNVYGFYTFAGLRRDFHDDSRPEIRTSGQLGGVGLRYDYTDEYWYDNPTDTTKVRVFGDLYDRALGSSFDYADWGVRASVVRPLLTRRTLVALEVLNAFSAPTGSDRVPNQGRYSLGGDLAIRGIPVQERLGENLALARLELRQMLPPELDLSLADVMVLRRTQLRLFVDTGHVEDRRESLYRLHDFAVGVGIAAFYDFLGFYPAVAYIAVAQRVDRFDGVDNQPQFLFGTRQAF
jgi:hypothetical protein